MASKKDSFAPRKEKKRKRYRAVYKLTKTVTVDAHNLDEARCELDFFFSAIRGGVTLVSIEEVEV